MPYKSLKQEGFFHTNPGKVGGKAVVAEWDRATRGMHLPKRVPHPEDSARHDRHASNKMGHEAMHAQGSHDGTQLGASDDA